jgi:hypothetical protein
MNALTRPPFARPRLGTLGLCGGLALLLFTAPGRAAGPTDTLDKALLKRSRQIMKDLRHHHYQNVGVLKFQVQRGDARPDLRVGRLNTLMATRLENALILADDMRHPIGITRAASEEAARKDLKATYLTAEGRQQLFAHAYPLAWGKGKVQVDAFLTGLVQVSPDGRTATVRVEAFDRADVGPRKVDEFSVLVDGLMLADMNRGFTLTRRAINGVAGDEDLDRAAAEAAAAPAPRLKLEDVLDFKIFYNDRLVKPNANGTVPTPAPGQKVHFVLKSTERLGVVLLVNGINTQGYEKGQGHPREQAYWVLEPNREYKIRGFYPDSGKVLPFKVVPPQAVDLSHLGDEGKLGRIDLDILCELDPKALPDKDTKATNLRDLPPRAATLGKLQGELSKMQSRKIRRKGVIIPDREDRADPIPEVSFRGRWAGHLTITYLEPAAAPKAGK